jgi:hypothetical protein
MRDQWICELDGVSMLWVGDLRRYNDGSVDVSEDVVCGRCWLVY